MSNHYREEGAIVFFLVVGLFFPTSLRGEYFPLFYQLNLVIAFGGLSYMIWKHKTRPGALTRIAFPILIILLVCTLASSLTNSFPIGPGTLAEYTLLAMVLSLDLRDVRVGRLSQYVLLAANLIGIACGVAIVFGNEWAAKVLTTSYTQFYPELVPNMIAFHKPVLTFGTHAVAGFFLYMFFWLNWETYNLRRSVLSLSFALSWLILLMALASVTALGFSALAFLQISVWLWKHHFKILVATVLCVVAGVFFAGRWAEDYFNVSDPAGLAVAFLTSDVSGPFARYASGGSESGKIAYLKDHPFSPVGFALPLLDASFVDSAPIQYLLRGSVPLLVLIYLGLYQFLRYNLSSPRIVLTLFFAILAFEIGFTALTYTRMFYLLPVAVVYLNHICEAPEHEVYHRPSAARARLKLFREA